MDKCLCLRFVEKGAVSLEAALAALRLAEPALRTLKDGHCDCDDCAYAKALDAVVAVLKEAK